MFLRIFLLQEKSRLKSTKYRKKSDILKLQITTCDILSGIWTPEELHYHEDVGVLVYAGQQHPEQEHEVEVRLPELRHLNTRKCEKTLFYILYSSSSYPVTWSV